MATVLGEEKGTSEVQCPKCGWKGRPEELVGREGEPEVADGFLIWLDMRRNRRVDMLCPKCMMPYCSKAMLYGHEFAPLRTRP